MEHRPRVAGAGIHQKKVTINPVLPWKARLQKQYLLRGEQLPGRHSIGIGHREGGFWSEKAVAVPGYLPMLGAMSDAPILPIPGEARSAEVKLLPLAREGASG